MAKGNCHLKQTSNGSKLNTREKLKEDSSDVRSKQSIPKEKKKLVKFGTGETEKINCDVEKIEGEHSADDLSNKFKSSNFGWKLLELNGNKDFTSFSTENESMSENLLVTKADEDA